MTDRIIIGDAEQGGVEDIVIEDDNPAQFLEMSDVIDEEAPLDGGLPPRAKLNGDGSVTLALRFPQTLKIQSARGAIREEKYDELRFYRLNGESMRAISATSRDTATTVAFARSLRMREATVRALYDKMDGADINDAGGVIEYFFGSGQKTGRSSSRQ